MAIVNSFYTTQQSQPAQQKAEQTATNPPAQQNQGVQYSKTGRKIGTFDEYKEEATGKSFVVKNGQKLYI